MITRRSFAASGLALALGTVAGGPVAAGGPGVSAPGGVALGGYDPVSYFATSGPQRGSRRHALMWKGATWLFASAANLAAFEANPRAYAPQYGGHCALAMARGRMRPGDPEMWSMVGGKLYFSASAESRGRWERDTAGHIPAGDRNWKAVRHGRRSMPLSGGD